MDYLVRVNMSTQLISREKVPVQYAGLGGRALTSALVYHEVPPAVSYTHLDVYKRQIYKMPMFPGHPACKI